MNDRPIKRDVIVIGASAGGVSALKKLCGALPADLPAVVGVVLHRGPWYGVDVSQIYGKAGRIRVKEARTGDRLERGILYFAPADRHMVFETTHLRLSREAKLHFCRPAIDQLFMSAATSFGKRVAGVLLTGANTDGARGLVHIKLHGGLTFVQRPDEAAQPTMPLSGLREDAPGLISLDTLPSLLISLATGRPSDLEQPEVPTPVMGHRRM
jgi:two-component system chemotaxis response regulator CheB